ncbi:MAG: ABC-type molybdate transport system ATPase subunit [Maribacter sp.]|jgi:ABC-type molybdate transport system ATPase subunit
MLGIGQLVKQKASPISGGKKQRVAIAAWEGPNVFFFKIRIGALAVAYA